MHGSSATREAHSQGTRQLLRPAQAPLQGVASVRGPRPAPPEPPTLVPTPPQVSLYGFIKLNGRHLPFAFLALDLLMGGDVWSDVMGILMGHM